MIKIQTCCFERSGVMKLSLAEHQLIRSGASTIINALGAEHPIASKTVRQLYEPSTWKSEPSR